MGLEAVENARLLEEILGGRPGPRLDVTLFNAGAGLVAAGVAADFKEGAALARASVASGKALGVLTELRKRGKA